MIRKAELSDLGRLTDIYNQAIESGRCTCDRETLTPEDRLGWFSEHTEERYPLYVAERDGGALGYVSLSPYKKRTALLNVAEVGYYVDFAHRHAGLGTEMLSFIIPEAKKLGFTDLVAVLIGCNAASEGLLQKSGFTEWGRLPGIADFDGRKEDHVYYGMHLQ